MNYFSEFTQPGFIFDQFLLYLFQTIIWSIYNDNNGLFFEHFSFPDVAPVLFKQRTIFKHGGIFKDTGADKNTHPSTHHS